MANEIQNRAPAPADVTFTVRLKKMAEKQLASLFAGPAHEKAVQRVVMAFIDAVKKAKKPGDYYDCTDASIAVAIATSAATGLYPGGPNPQVYLVPMRPNSNAPMELNWWITHRGLARLAFEAGFGVRAVPVCKDDKIVISFGEVAEHTAANEDFWPSSLTDLRGIVVVVRALKEDMIVCRSWVPLALIQKRKSKSKMSGSGPWVDWPIEMAQKTAIKYVFARGEVPCEFTTIDIAVEADNRGEVIHTSTEGVEVIRTPTEPARPLPPHMRAGGQAPALPDHGEHPPLLEGEPDRQPADYGDIPPEEANPAPQS